MNSALLDRFGTAIVDLSPSDQAWHAWRAGGIGASECAAALGISRYMSPFKLYQIKIGAIAPDKPNESMLLGLEMEPAVLASYSRRRNRRIIAKGVCVQHPKYPFLRATIDGVDDDGRNVEAKTTRWSKADEWGPDGDVAGIPLRVIAQVQHQSLICDADSAVAVLIGGEDLRTYDVPRSGQIAAHIIARLSAFWECVQSRTPPEPTEEDGPTLNALAPTTDEPALLGEWEAQLVDAWNMNKNAASRFEDAADEAKYALVRSLGSSSLGILPDGRQVVRTEVKVKGYSVEPKSYFRLDVKTPKGGR